jgi:hypothetical protein
LISRPSWRIFWSSNGATRTKTPNEHEPTRTPRSLIMKTLAAALLALSTLAAVAPAHAFGPRDLPQHPGPAFGPSDLSTQTGPAFGPRDLPEPVGPAFGPSDVRSFDGPARSWVIETLGDRK